MLRKSLFPVHNFRRVRFGINMRHIGKVRDKATRPYVRMLLLTAMVARVCKAALISILREQAKRLKVRGKRERRS